MSYQRISLGSPLLLRLQTGDGATGKFPRATVFDSAHAAVAGSPFDLTHIGNGLYANEAFVPGSVDHYDASYTVYSDAGHTTVDPTYNYDTDSFDVYVLGSGGSGGSSGGCVMTGVVMSNQIVATISAPSQLIATVCD